MKNIEECEGYKKLLVSVERDEKESPGFHDYRKTFAWVLARAAHYAEKTGLEAADILDSWEKARDYWYMNYYQEANQPEIKGEQVRVFNTTKELIDSIGNEGFRCPLCEGVSRSPYRCDSGIIIKKIKDDKDGPCNWNVGGLFGDLGKGVFVFVKERTTGERIFAPVAWE